MTFDWKTSTLGEILEKTPTVNPLQLPDTAFDYIDVSSVSNQTFSIEKTQRLKGKDAPSRARKLVRTNDILFATIRPTLQRIAMVPNTLDKQVCSTGYFVLRPKSEVDHRFVFHYLFSDDFMDTMKSLQKGASYPAVTDAEVRQQPFAFPPLNEQQRIVAILDEAFDGIATAKANAEKNLQNARAIFESYLQSVFIDEAKEWPNRLLGDEFHIGSSKRIYETDWTSHGVSFFGGREIVKLAKYGSVESASFISEEKYQEYASKYEMPLVGDILMTARGTIGVGYIVKPGDKFYYKDGNVISLRAKNSSSPQFVLYAFKSNAILDQLTALVGTTVSHLPIEKAKMLKICLPTFEVQNFIVQRLEMMEAHSKNLESIYRKKIATLGELKKSLLHQAFSGKL